MSQTPYQRKLWEAANQAHSDRDKSAEALIREMIEALENGRYGDLQGTWEALPPKYAAMAGTPPRTQADDQ